jgi:hypothetical protein
LFLLLLECSGNSHITGTILLANKSSSTENQKTFSSLEKIYAIVQVSGLNSGKHKAVVNWVAPEGNIDQQIIYPFTTGNQTSFTFHSWFKLMRNGPLKTEMLGKRVDEEYLGIWEVHVFVDDTMLTTTSFEIY